MHGTRPNPKRGKGAVVEVTDLESAEQFTIDTEHAVLNIPSEVSPATLTSLFNRFAGDCEGRGG